MKAATLTLAVLAAIASTSAAAAQPDAGADNGRYLVVFKTEAVPTDVAARIARNGGQLVREFDQIGVAAVTGDAAFASRMARDTKVLSVGAEHLFAMPETATFELAESEAGSAEGAPTAADNLHYYQWDMRRIGAPAVWARLPVAASVPRVAVLDTGVMDNHSDLIGQVDSSVSFTYCNTSGGPNNSAAYPAYSTLIDFDAHPSWSPSDGCTAAATRYEAHGTHVAGTIAAKFGGGRVVGVAPDAKVGAYKVFDRYRFTGANGVVVDSVGAFDGPLFSAIIHATQSGYPVLSMSLGSHVLRNDKGSNASWLAWDRIAKWANRNGALLIASSGNSAYDLNGKLAHVPSDLSTVLSTSATGTNQMVGTGVYSAAPGSDVLADYSNYGSSVDIAAPGGDCGPVGCQAKHLILSTIITGTGAPAYSFYAGTSMATPHVSAVAAYVRSMHPAWTPGAVRSWLKETAQPIGSRQAFGAGMVDVDAAAR